MLTNFRFKNFKAWNDSGNIRLAPLTVFFGTNSAGKTSIPQLLLLLKQTAESSDRQRALQLGDSRTTVDLGTYDDVTHNHNVDQPLDFTFEWKLAQSLDITDPIAGSHYNGSALRFSASIVSDERRQPAVLGFEYELLESSDTALDLKLWREQTGDTFDLTSQRYSLARQQGRALPIPRPLRFYGFPDEVAAYFQNSAFTDDFVLELERLLRSIYYVGPIREYARRLYLWSGEVPDHVGTKGDRAVEAILAGGERQFSLSSKDSNKGLAAIVAEQLHRMKMIEEFEVKALGEHRKEYEVLVRTRARLPQVKLTDVGFGVSQVLPVIVECFYVPRRSIVIFEQPEIHLHPSVQADLADLFIDAIHAREDGIPRDCQFIIESHSEHFLRRLQRRIAEESISKDEAALYFVHTDGDSARIEALAVDDFGNIRNWPDNFFGDEMADMVARSDAQANRKTRTSNK